jgi:hypothetical protein
MAWGGEHDWRRDSHEYEGAMEQAIESAMDREIGL